MQTVAVKQSAWNHTGRRHYTSTEQLRTPEKNKPSLVGKLAVGLEPTTLGLDLLSSTIELHQRLTDEFLSSDLVEYQIEA